MLKLSAKTQISVSPLMAKVMKLCLFFLTTVFVSAALANPVLQNISSGNVTVNQAGNTTTVNQSSSQAIINWNSFNINANEKTQFVQPNSNSVALNRINPTQGASQIFGTLTANGKIILINAAGFNFASGSIINVGGMIASTANISDTNFLAGNYVFDQPSILNGSIINNGRLIAQNYGLIALLSSNVQNNGLIQAELGNVVLAAGSKFTLAFNGDQLINFSVDAPANNAHISNAGTIVADGGKILVSARAAQTVLDNVINMQGVATANSVLSQSGQIILDGGEGNVVVSGKLSASGKQAGGSGGIVKVLANNIHLTGTAGIDTSGDLGGGTILVGGSNKGSGPEQNALTTTVDRGAVLSANAITIGNGGNIVVWSNNNTDFHGSASAKGGAQSGNGGSIETSGHLLNIAGAAIDLSAAHGHFGTWLLDPYAVTISSASTTLADPNVGYSQNADSNINIIDLTNALALANVSIEANGAQGDIIVNAPISWSSNTTLSLTASEYIAINSPITALNGGLTLSAMNGSQGFNATIGSTNANAAAGTVPTTMSQAINVANFTLASGQWLQLDSTLPDFQVSNDFVIGNGNSYNGSYNAQFTRLLDTNGVYGVGDVFGLQGLATGPLNQSYVLANNIDASKTIHWNNGSGFVPIGSQNNPYTSQFNGQNFVINDLSFIPTSARNSGLFGVTNGAAISNVGLNNLYIYDNVNQGSNAVGGLVGFARSGTNITNSYVNGNITLATYGYLGGLVGTLEGSIFNSYNAATITGGNGSSMGGLAGLTANANISNSYSAGILNILGAPTVGGITGYTYNSTFTNNYVSSVFNNFTQTSLNGAFIGFYTGTNTYSGNLFDTTTTGTQFAGQGGALTGVYGKTTTELMQLSTYVNAGWSTTSGNAGSITATPSTSSVAPNYTWYIFDGQSRPLLISEYSTVINNAHQLQLMGTTLGASYTLASNIDLNSSMQNAGYVWATSLANSIGAGFVPIGTPANPFTGSLNGQGHNIANLYINSDSTIGLFGVLGTSGVVQNVNVTDASVASANGISGIIAGTALDGSLISHVFTSGNISGHQVGGIVGNEYGNLFDSSSTAAVVSNGNDAGGLVGDLYGNGYVNKSFFAGNVFAQTGASIGGLIGFIQDGNSRLENSYNLGSVNAVDVGNGIGGAVGYLYQGSITNVYSIGQVTLAGSGSIGGLVGFEYNSGPVTHSFWNTQTSGVASDSSTALGLTTAQMMQESNYTGFDFTNTWGILPGTSYAYLKDFYASAPRVISGNLSSGSASSTSTVTLAVNGANLANHLAAGNVSQQTSYLGADGSYYFLEGGSVIPNTINGNQTVLLAYLTNGGLGNAITLAPLATNGSVTHFDITVDGVSVGDASHPANTFSNSILVDAIRHPDQLTAASSNILFSANGTDLTFRPNSQFAVNANSASGYTIDGGITIGGDNGALNFAVPVTFNNNNAVVNVASQTYNNTVTLLSGANLTGSGVTNTIQFNGGISGLNGQNLVLEASSNNTTSYFLPANMTSANISILGDIGSNVNITVGSGENLQWNFTGANTGNIGAISGNPISNGSLSFDLSNSAARVINGSGGSDTYVFGANSSFSGSINDFITLDSNGNPLNTNTLDFSNLGYFIQVFFNNSTITNNHAINSGASYFALPAFNGINHIIGDANFADGSYLYAGLGDNHFVLSGHDEGVYTDAQGIAVAFSHIGNLTSGESGINTYVFNDGSTLSGGIYGGSTGSTVLDLSNYLSATDFTLTGSGSSGFSGSSAGILTYGFNNVAELIGSNTASNTLTGEMYSENTWNITANNAGSYLDNTTLGLGLPGLTFSHFGNYVGGYGNDVYLLSDGVTVSSITGIGGNSRLDASAYTTPISVNLQTNTFTGINGSIALDHVTSFVGNDINQATNGSPYVPALSTLIGLDADTIWNISSYNAGDVNSQTYSFFGFGNLAASTGNSSAVNTFIFQDGASLSGVLTGGPGTNIIDTTNYQTPVTINLQDNRASTVVNSVVTNLIGGGFSDIKNFNASQYSGSTIIATNINNTWDIIGDGTGSLNTDLNFNGFSNLVGGTGNDNFILNSGVTFNGSVDGGLGNVNSINTLDLSGNGTPTTATLYVGSQYGIQGLANNTAFENLTVLLADTDPNNLASNVLINDSTTDATFAINADNAGVFTTNGGTLSFSDFSSLAATQGNNTYAFSNNGTLLGNIHSTTTGNSILTGDVNANEITIVNGPTYINGHVNALAMQYYQNPIVLLGDSTLTSNQFMLEGGASGAYALTLQGAPTALGDASNITYYTGGSFSTNSFTINGFASGTNTYSIQSTNPVTTTLTQHDGGNITGMGTTIDFNHIQNLFGSDNNESFVINGGSLSGAIFGGTGVNTLIGDNVANVWQLTGNHLNTGNINGTVQYYNIQNLVGGNVSNQFVFNDGATVSGSITGGNVGSNAIDLSNYSTALTVTTTADNVGYVTDSNSNAILPAFSHITDVAGNNNTVLAIDTASPNTVDISGAGAGVVNDPISFTGINSISSIGSGVTTINFGMPVQFDASTGTATINGTNMLFTNINNFNFYNPAPPVVTTPPPTTNIITASTPINLNTVATTPNIISIANAPSIKLVSIITPANSYSSAGSSSSYSSSTSSSNSGSTTTSSGTADSSDSGNSDSVVVAGSPAEMAIQSNTQISANVAQNVGANVVGQQTSQDTLIIQSQSISTNCS